jgi:hypothetical protein
MKSTYAGVIPPDLDVGALGPPPNHTKTMSGALEEFSDNIANHWADAEKIQSLLDTEAKEMAHHTAVYEVLKSKYLDIVNNTPSIITPQEAIDIHDTYHAQLGIVAATESMINYDKFRYIWDVINDVFDINSVVILDIELSHGSISNTEESSEDTKDIENTDRSEDTRYTEYNRNDNSKFVYCSPVTGIAITFRKKGEDNISYVYYLPIGYYAICYGNECFCEQEGKLIKHFSDGKTEYSVTLASHVIPEMFKYMLLRAVDNDYL